MLPLYQLSAHMTCRPLCDRRLRRYTADNCELSCQMELADKSREFLLPYSRVVSAGGKGEGGIESFSVTQPFFALYPELMDQA